MFIACESVGGHHFLIHALDIMPTVHIDQFFGELVNYIVNEQLQTILPLPRDMVACSTQFKSDILLWINQSWSMVCLAFRDPWQSSDWCCFSIQIPNCLFNINTDWGPRKPHLDFFLKYFALVFPECEMMETRGRLFLMLLTAYAGSLRGACQKKPKLQNGKL